MEFLTIILFIIYLYGLGYNLSRFDKDFTFESFIMRMGLGLGAFPVVALLLTSLKIPLDYRIFLLLSTVPLVWDFRKKLTLKGIFRRDISPRLNLHFLSLLIIFFISLSIYCVGPFLYPWLEDSDSWHHAAGVKFIAVEKNINIAPGVLKYINPYPPAYDIILGVLHQTSPSLYWTLKFFNGFIIALGFLFFYFLAKEWSGDENRALLSTFLLACIPCYLSHFIWAHSLVVTLFFPALYLSLKSFNDKKFIIPAGIVVAGICLTQPEQALKFLIIFLLVMVPFGLKEKNRLKKMTSVLAVGLDLALLLWWAKVGIDIVHHKTGLVNSAINVNSGVQINPITNSQSFLKLISNIFSSSSGSATRAYTWKDYFFIPPIRLNKVNNIVGVGFILSILALMGILRTSMLIFKKDSPARYYHAGVFGWFIFCFLAINSKTFHLPIGLYAFRTWMLLAVPVSLLAAESILWIKTRILSSRSLLGPPHSASNDSSRFPLALYPALAKMMVALILFLICIDSGFFKVKVNTDPWQLDLQYWTSAPELEGYLWLRHNLKKDTKVFAFTNSFLLLGVDMFNGFWQKKYQDLLSDALTQPAEELHKNLKETGYEYIIISKREQNLLGDEAFNSKLNEIIMSPLFTGVYNRADQVWIFKVT